MEEKFPNSPIIADFKTQYGKRLAKEARERDKEEKKLVKANTRVFRKLLNQPFRQLSDSRFFRKKMNQEQQLDIITKLRSINNDSSSCKLPYRISIIQSSFLQNHHKLIALKKIDTLNNMDFGDTEYFKLRNWVQTFMEIPFGIYREVVLHTENKPEVSDFMSNAFQTLNNAVYGLDDAKIQIMQMLGQLVTNPLSVGSSIAIQGPPGTGKTSLVKEGISKILGRPFNFIALGGATDSSYLEGHSYTYEGSTWGKIVQILLSSKCMNPVIYFDELDKISDTPKGEEIVGILTHLTDTSQNSEFHDKYFSELDFNLSKCLFIFSYNDESRVHPVLKDRMYRIYTKGYDVKQKVIIAKNFLLPAIREQVKFVESEVVIPDDVLVYIIDNFCMKEEGVRNLKRCLEIVFTKLNLFRLMDTDTELLSHKDFKGLVFPSLSSSSSYVLTKANVDILIKKREDENMSYKAMYL